jgi:hypothetical protein
MDNSGAALLMTLIKTMPESKGLNAAAHLRDQN